MEMVEGTKRKFPNQLQDPETRHIRESTGYRVYTRRGFYQLESLGGRTNLTQSKKFVGGQFYLVFSSKKNIISENEMFKSERSRDFLIRAVSIIHQVKFSQFVTISRNNSYDKLTSEKSTIGYLIGYIHTYSILFLQVIPILVTISCHCTPTPPHLPPPLTQRHNTPPLPPIPPGCHVHDGRSPLVDRWLPLPPYLNLFVSTTSQNGSSNFGLAFQSQTTGYAGLKKVDLDVGRWKGSPTATRQWFKVQLSRHGKTAVKISWRGNETSVNVPSGKNVFSVTNVDSVFWSLYCYPDVARGQESWIRHASPDLQDPTTNPDPDENEGDQDPGINEQTEEEAKEKGEEGEEEEEGNVGEGQVWAWVLTGMAFFLVMILALALCTRMRPRHEITSHGDYLPSIGIVSHRHTAEAGGREAEEMSEPGSPTIPVPVINHKLPEENDQSTKKL
ncbi:uncharacterized protein LOC122257276 [Penaeus japonicus]|uniref:uncharacterized protein LOC122257276 n=1 Tax=Penaeus japonicus TaxID=27405 RepID=UPI001C70BF4B|nr:uncharacterized protein LOC122257276 [Penaeus japonicus]